MRTAPRENLARCCSGGSLTWGWRAAAGQGGSRRGDSRPRAALTTHRCGPAVWMPAGPASMGAVSGCRAALTSRSRITTLCERESPEGPAPWIPSVVRVERSLHQKPPCPLPCPPSCVRPDPVSLPHFWKSHHLLPRCSGQTPPGHQVLPAHPTCGQSVLPTGSTVTLKSASSNFTPECQASITTQYIFLQHPALPRTTTALLLKAVSFHCSRP